MRRGLRGAPEDELRGAGDPRGEPRWAPEAANKSHIAAENRRRDRAVPTAVMHRPPHPHRGGVAREDAGEGRRRAATGLPVGQGTQGTGVRPQTRDRENRQIAVSAELERSFREPKKVPNLRQNRSISALGLPRRDL